MYYTIYKTTNIINNKIYIGTHKTSNLNDEYMGSGKILLLAIKKYGKKNFEKEILEVFDNSEDMFLKEKQLVNEDFIKRTDTYNLKVGGIGGFDHINKLPKDQRPNLIKIQELIKSGNFKYGGGAAHWSEEGRKRVLAQSWGAKRARGELEPNTWKHLTEEEKIIRKQKLSQSHMGEKNGNWGTSFYIDPDVTELPDKKNREKFRFKLNQQPSGWITFSEWRDNKKEKIKGCYGRKWFNDGSKEFLLKINDPRIIKLNLSRGRILPLFRDTLK